MFSSTTPGPGAADAVIESARVVRSDRGLRVNGYLVAPGAEGFGAWYSLLCDPQGRLRRLTLRADSASGEKTLSLTHATGSPWVLSRGDSPESAPELSESTDLVLAGSLLSHTLPIATHLPQLQQGSTLTVTVAVVEIPGLQITSREASYRTVAIDPEGVMDVAVTIDGVEQSVLVGPDGLVVGRAAALTA